MRPIVVGCLALVLLGGTVLAKQGAPAFETLVVPSDVDTTLYFHPLHAQDMPINTQEPAFQPAFEGSGWGTGTTTLRCLHETTGDVGGTGQGTGGTTSQRFHTYYGYSSGSFVEYDYTSASGEPRTHPERGLGHDIPVNVSTPVVLHWYMAEALGANAEAQAGPLVNVRVQAVVQAGDPMSVDDKAYDSGAVLMQGSTLPVTAFAGQVAGAGADQVSASQVGGRWVYGFHVPLDVLASTLPQRTGFIVRIDALVDNAACTGDGTLMTGTADVYADAAHAPRLELRHGAPLRVDGASVSQSNGTLVLAWQPMSAWGNYDVDVDQARLEVFGPTDVTPTLESTVQRYQEHYHMFDPVKQTWTLDASELPAGRYTAVFTVPNHQHTAVAEARVVFYMQEGELRTDEPQEAPGLPFLGVLAVVVALGVLVRPRAH